MKWLKTLKVFVWIIISLFIFVGSVSFFLAPPVWYFSDADAYSKLKLKHNPKSPEWVQISEVSKHFIHAAIIAEDSHFYNHHGVDFDQTVKSIKLNLESGKIVRGGSTITQQLIKNTFFSSKKSYIRKAKELLGSLLVERYLSKKEILEWYVNNIHFGQGVDGIKEAASFYAQTSPQLLTIEDSIKLALILPNPDSRSKSFRHETLGEFDKKRYRLILKGMFEAGYITEQQRTNSLLTGDFGRPLEDKP